MRFLALIALCLCALFALTAAEANSKVCACPRNFDPVCGSDGRNYSNECDLKCSAERQGRSISVAKKGHC